MTAREKQIETFNTINSLKTEILELKSKIMKSPVKSCKSRSMVE
jgi:hypothetical protein